MGFNPRWGSPRTRHRAFVIGLLCLSCLTPTHLKAQTPPTPTSTAPHPFALLPILEDISDPKFTEPQIQAEMTKLKAQIGESHGDFRVGFSHILQSRDSLMRHCRLAVANNEAVGVIIAVQTHTGGVRDTGSQDFRRLQWRLDGKTWEGESVVAKNGNPEYPSRDWRLPTPSRYCAANHEAAMAEVRAKAQIIRAAMDAYPNTITVVNAAIEEELATGGEKSDGLLSDYSPFAITEFRDYLRHTGKYDDTSGAYAHQGAPEAIVGPFVRIGGVMRPQFYDDPSPDESAGTGKSFNTLFGTKFTTWTLRNWDLDRFPDPITDRGFSPAPDFGAGFTNGGFDAPRVRDPKNIYWQAWSWDVIDQGNTYPPGNPTHPAFGFRQVEVKHFVSDVLDEIHRAGVPTDLLYAHQIPAEQVGATRLRSGADPIWTGLYEPAGTVGITRFGPIDVRRINQYSHNWGIFEWHPLPNAKPDDPKLYTAASHDVESYYQSGARVLFPGWWHPGGRAPAGDIFPLNDSQFAKALHDWLASKP